MAKQPVVDSLREKVSRVIDDNIRLRGERDELYGVQGKLKVENRELKQKLTEVERRVNVLELGSGFGFAANGESDKRAKARVNQLMREIDRCIALMNR